VRLATTFLLAALLFGCASAHPTSGHPNRVYAVRLHPGDDLRLSLEALAKEKHLHAGYVVTCVGSLRKAAIRFADRKETEMVEGPLEIVSLVGTLSPDGPHLHISVSDGNGKTIGGHLSEGSLVYTTAEIVVADIAGVGFAREVDPATTFKELVVREAQ
jgi:predicted DNA-binding protein with PD1-like motif